VQLDKQCLKPGKVKKQDLKNRLDSLMNIDDVYAY